MDFQNNYPIYLQIMDQIKKEIVLGRKQLGEKLLSTREYAQLLKVNVNTIVRVFNELEREGIVYSKRGIGTFITESEEMAVQMKDEMAERVLRDFVLGMKELGFTKGDMLELLRKDFEKSGLAEKEENQ